MKMGTITSIVSKIGSHCEMSDVQLIAACTNGDRGALEMLFQRYHGVVNRYLARLTGEQQWELDDMSQDTFINAFQSAGKYAGKSAVKTWLLGIATNVARNRIRSHSRNRKKLGAVINEPMPTSYDPAELVERRETIARIQSAMDGLSYKERVVFTMCALEGIAGTEAAKILKIRTGTLWRRLHDARKRIAQSLEGEDR